MKILSFPGMMTRKEFIQSMGSCAAALSAASLGFGRAARAQDAQPIPPNQNIAWANARWEVYPAGVPSQDVFNVQWAVDQGGTVLLKAGTFNFGDDSTGRQTVVVTRGVNILGETLTDTSGKVVQWNTNIFGGGALLPSLVFQQSIESGAFKVMNFGASPAFPGIPPGDDLPVVLDGLKLTGWAAEAVLVEACRGFEIKHCSIGGIGKSMTYQGYHFVHAYFAVGPFCAGNFLVIDNDCVMDYANQSFSLPDDENFCTCLSTNFKTITVSRNRIAGHDEGIEILCNARPVEGVPVTPESHTVICVQDNSVDVNALVGDKWLGHGGITCCGNQNTDSVLVSGNDVSMRGGVIAYLLSGHNFIFRENNAKLAPLDPAIRLTDPTAGLAMGFNIQFPGLPDLGPSLWDSIVTNNKISGHSTFGIMTMEANLFLLPPGVPPQFPWNQTHNVVGFGNNLSALSVLPSGSHLFLAPMTYNNDFRGNYGTALDLGNNAEYPNRITGYDKRMGGIGQEVSEGMRRIADKMQRKVLMLQALNWR